MTPERWARIKAVFSAARELPDAGRGAFLQQACGDDDLVRDEAAKLLAASRADLDSPVAEMIATAVAPELREGSAFGRYRIERRIGRGGMGAVYRAYDTQLARPVALKILPPEYNLDAERRSRFLREARAAAAIAHPNIVSVFEAGIEGGVAFVAMEFVDGRTLEDIIAASGLPIRLALDYAIEVADGLAAAHAVGIVHRDLKPGNIMIGADGRIKLLDFGLAKRVKLGPGSDTTLTIRGEILGTAAYMSPEQAEGKDVDARSDIFSFGAVLYEMLSGRRAFSGDSAMSILGAVLRESPAPLAGVPAELAKLVSRCLRKEPSRRVQHITDVRLLLEEIREDAIRHRRRPPSAVVGCLAGIAVGLLLAAVLYLTAAPEPASGGQFTPIAAEGAAETKAAWSPDGKAIAYLMEVDGVSQVFARTLNSTSPVAITKSANDCGPPFWSVDGTRVYYTSGGSLWSSGVAGGAARLEIRDVQAAGRSRDGKLLALVRGVMGAQTLWTTAAVVPNPVQYVREPFPKTFVAGYQPTFFPDGSRIGVVVDRGSGGGAGEFWILPVGSGTPRRVPATLTASAWLRYDYWTRSDRLVIGRSDPGNQHLHLLDMTSGALRQFTYGTGWESEPAISPDGKRIAFTSGRTDYDLIEVPLDGSPVRSLLATGRDEESGAWLPSAAEFAYITNAGGKQEIWLRRASDIWSRPILASGAAGVPPWYFITGLRASPNGQQVAYDVLSAQHWIWISPVNGAWPVPLERESSDQHSPSWSPDGTRIAYRRLRNGQFELATTPLGGGTPIPLGPTGSGGHQSGGVTDWSPTSEWICHNSPHGLELVSPGGEQRRLLTTTAFRSFVFSHDGSTLYVLRRRQDRRWELASFDVKSGAERATRELPLPAGASLSELTRHPQGKRLLVTMGTPRQDIWLMEDFDRPRSWWERLHWPRF